MERVTQIVIAVYLVSAMVVVAISVLAYTLSKEKPQSTTKQHPKLADDRDLMDFLDSEFAKNASEVYSNLKNAQWDHETDTEDADKLENWLEAIDDHISFCSRNWHERFAKLDPDVYSDELLERQVMFGRFEMAEGALDENKTREYSSVRQKMLELYSKAKICPHDDQDCNTRVKGLSHSQVQEVFQNSTDYDKLVYLWTEWRLATGFKMRKKKLYQKLIELSNEQATACDFEDKAEMWQSLFESGTFKEDIRELWKEIEPLYVKIHEYVGLKLKTIYKDKLDMSDGLLPAHIFGDLYAIKWVKIRNFVKPYPNASSIGDSFGAKGARYSTVHNMLEAAFEFYESMGFNVPKKRHVTEKQEKIECRADAWDFFDGENYRIKKCAEVNFEDFVDIHQLIGRVVYYVQYSIQSLLLRRNPAPGFIQGVADAVSLSAQTAGYLGIEPNDQHEFLINSLMDIALNTVVSLPFALVVDRWRRDVFGGKVTEDEWNSLWWDYRRKYQRLKPPTDRSDEKGDFDPGGYYQLINDESLTNYFVSGVLQFQIYKSLCAEVGDFKGKKIYKCDLSGSKEVGKKLMNGMSLGASKPWKKILESIIEETELDTSALLEYFEPLHEFLKKQNTKQEK